MHGGQETACRQAVANRAPPLLCSCRGPSHAALAAGRPGAPALLLKTDGSNGWLEAAAAQQALALPGLRARRFHSAAAASQEQPDRGNVPPEVPPRQPTEAPDQLPAGSPPVGGRGPGGAQLNAVLLDLLCRCFVHLPAPFRQPASSCNPALLAASAATAGEPAGVHDRDRSAHRTHWQGEACAWGCVQLPGTTPRCCACSDGPRAHTPRCCACFCGQEVHPGPEPPSLCSAWCRCRTTPAMCQR